MDYDENKKRMKSLVEDLHVIEIWSLMKLCREKLGQNNELMDYEKQLIKDGHFLMAVKSVRHRTCLGLRECKQICDKYDEELKQSQACVQGASAPVGVPVEDWLHQLESQPHH